MLEKLNMKDLPGWVILSFSAVIITLFLQLLKAKDELRVSDVEHRIDLAKCREDQQKKADGELSEWKAAFAALKKENDEKMIELKKIKKR
jgi:hypothetical protein